MKQFVLCLLLISSYVCLGMLPCARTIARTLVNLYHSVPKPLAPTYIKIVAPNSYLSYKWHCSDRETVFAPGTEDVSPHIATYIRSQLSKHSVKNSQNIRVITHPDFHSSGILFETVFLLAAQEKKLIDTCITAHATVKPYQAHHLKLIEAIIAHEAHHINESHSHRIIIEPAIAVVLATPLYYRFKKILSHQMAQNMHRSWSLGCAFYACVVVLSKMRSRSFERSADEAIPNDYALLSAAQHALEKTHSSRTWLEDILASHPTPEQRAARFKERVTALETANIVNQTQTRL